MWVVLDEELFGHFGLLRNLEPTFDAEDQIDQAHDQCVLRIEREHLEEHLARVHFLQCLECFQRKRRLLSTVQIRHLLDELEVVFPLSL